MSRQASREVGPLPPLPPIPPPSPFFIILHEESGDRAFKPRFVDRTPCDKWSTDRELRLQLARAVSKVGFSTDALGLLAVRTYRTQPLQ